VLDEPLAPLDPVARHEFLASVMETAAGDGMSVLFSSHVVAELERIADYLVVLADGHVQVTGDVETLLGGHQILTACWRANTRPAPSASPGPLSVLEKSAGEPGSAAAYRELIIADALHQAMEQNRMRPADRTHRWPYGPRT